MTSTNRPFCAALGATLTAIALGAFGCGGAEPKQAASPGLTDPGGDGALSPDWPDLGRGDARYIDIALGDDFETCRRISPKFPFDSARTRAQDRAQLEAFASCMNNPDMTTRTVLLVGRADENGSADYNKDLGMKRALRIKELLVKYGVAEGRIDVKSKGEAGAVGSQPEFSHGYDRRVDVVVRGGVHAPVPR